MGRFSIWMLAMALSCEAWSAEVGLRVLAEADARAALAVAAAGASRATRLHGVHVLDREAPARFLLVGIRVEDTGVGLGAYDLRLHYDPERVSVFDPNRVNVPPLGAIGFARPHLPLGGTSLGDPLSVLVCPHLGGRCEHDPADFATSAGGERLSLLAGDRLDGPHGAARRYRRFEAQILGPLPIGSGTLAVAGIELRPAVGAGARSFETTLGLAEGVPFAGDGVEKLLVDDRGRPIPVDVGSLTLTTVPLPGAGSMLALALLLGWRGARRGPRPRTRRPFGRRGSRARLAMGVSAGMSALLVAQSAGARAFDLLVTDVATRAFSVVWAVDEALAPQRFSVGVFEHASTGGVGAEVTSALATTLRSDDLALANGVVKMDVVGLRPGTRYHVRAYTEHRDGARSVLPEHGPGLPVRTAVAATRLVSGGRVIANPLLRVELGETPADSAGTLLAVRAPRVSPYPLTAFFGRSAAGAALVDTGNLFDVEGVSAEIGAGEVLELIWYRGRQCADPARRHRRRLYRRVPSPGDDGLLEVRSPARCPPVDTFCDGVVDMSDVRRIARVLGSRRDSDGCRFEPELDVFGDDGIIDVSDLRAVVRRLGERLPFLH